MNPHYAEEDGDIDSSVVLPTGQVISMRDVVAVESAESLSMLATVCTAFFPPTDQGAEDVCAALLDTLLWDEYPIASWLEAGIESEKDANRAVFAYALAVYGPPRHEFPGGGKYLPTESDFWARFDPTNGRDLCFVREESPAKISLLAPVDDDEPLARLATWIDAASPPDQDTELFAVFREAFDVGPRCLLPAAFIAAAIWRLLLVRADSLARMPNSRRLELLHIVVSIFVESDGTFLVRDDASVVVSHVTAELAGGQFDDATVFELFCHDLTQAEVSAGSRVLLHRVVGRSDPTLIKQGALARFSIRWTHFTVADRSTIAGASVAFLFQELRSSLTVRDGSVIDVRNATLPSRNDGGFGLHRGLFFNGGKGRGLNVTNRSSSILLTTRGLLTDAYPHAAPATGSSACSTRRDHRCA